MTDNPDNVRAAVHGNAAYNGKPGHHAYIADAKVRHRVNDALERSVVLAAKTERGGPMARADYYRANADLLKIRPPMDDESAMRQRRTINHLHALADALDLDTINRKRA